MRRARLSFVPIFSNQVGRRDRRGSAMCAPLLPTFARGPFDDLCRAFQELTDAVSLTLSEVLKRLPLPTVQLQHVVSVAAEPPLCLHIVDAKRPNNAAAYWAAPLMVSGVVC